VDCIAGLDSAQLEAEQYFEWHRGTPKFVSAQQKTNKPKRLFWRYNEIDRGERSNGVKHRVQSIDINTAERKEEGGWLWRTNSLN
jgi:hypothetical protein